MPRRYTVFESNANDWYDDKENMIWTKKDAIRNEMEIANDMIDAYDDHVMKLWGTVCDYMDRGYPILDKDKRGTLVKFFEFMYNKTECGKRVGEYYRKIHKMHNDSMVEVADKFSVRDCEIKRESLLVKPKISISPKNVLDEEKIFIHKPVVKGQSWAGLV
jgi:hypothetical protein